MKLIDHWNKVYSKKPEDQLGWYEKSTEPTLRLIKQANLSKSAHILHVGAGSTTLVDELVGLGYENLWANDISEVALQKLANRVGENNISCVQDDLTHPIHLEKIAPVDLWIDRAVLHFFTEEEDQKTYFDLMKRKVKTGGFAIIAQFHLSGADSCSGLPVKRYSTEILKKTLQDHFVLVDHFERLYIMPSGAERPYVYTLFQRKSQ
jgi:SAM-dependent methyltransferase